MSPDLDVILAQRLADVLRIHRPHTPHNDPIGLTTPHTERCGYCYTPWPCTTARACGVKTTGGSP